MSARVVVSAQLPASGTAGIAFVGEAPGDTEEDTGIPLSGPPGKVFDQALRSAGITRAECLVTNVFDFKLPKNDVATIATARRADIDKLPIDNYWAPWAELPVASGKYLPLDAVEAALSRLEAELRAARPKVIVPMGGTAVWAVCQLKAQGVIKKVRGAWRHCVLYPEAAVLPSYHPAYVLRSYHLFPMLAMDFAKAAKIRDGHSGKMEYEILTVKKPSDIADFLARLEPPVAVDIETVRSELIDCIGFSDARRGFTVPIFDDRSFAAAWSEADEVAARQIVCDFLASSTPKVLQNGCYDTQMLWEAWRTQVHGWTDDTRILHKVLFPELPADLGSMASLHTFGGGHKAEYRASREKRNG